MKFEQWVEKRKKQKNRYDKGLFDHLRRVDVEVDGIIYTIPADEPFLWQKWSHEEMKDEVLLDMYKNIPNAYESMQRARNESWHNCKFYFKLRNGFI